MDLTVSRPIKILALVAVIAATAGVGMLMLKPKQAAAPPVVITKAAAAPATTTPSAPQRTATTPATATSAPTAHRATARKAIRPAKLPAVAKNGLPTAIDLALESHRIVVVSVFDPQSATDAISYAEAKSGAADARVGFVGISLLDSTLAAALTSALPGGGLLPAPGVLIYRRPGVLVQRIDGFTDRDVVAQAAAASVTAPPYTGSGA
ncbi:MAG: hypothetical protein ACJ768_05730 [Gaiellaceae bacterium]